jgi:peptidoglycan hydrolase-like protein with peptidoglycan-binding domain
MNTTELQEALITLGYDVGSSGADGKFGAKSKAALSSFQAAHGLTATGLPDAATEQAITLEIDKLDTTIFGVSYPAFGLLLLGGVGASMLTYWGLGKVFGRKGQSARSDAPRTLSYAPRALPPVGGRLEGGDRTTMVSGGDRGTLVSGGMIPRQLAPGYAGPPTDPMTLRTTVGIVDDQADAPNTTIVFRNLR